MKIVYDKRTGNIMSAISSDQNPYSYYRDFSNEVKENLAYIRINDIPTPLAHYYVTDGEIKKYSEEQIAEKRIYGRVLTKEERQLEKLKPSLDEIRKAENTIEILTLIQEVM